MTTFDEREHAFENKFAHDAEMQFRAEARRNRLLGQWAAGVLGLTGEEAELYTHAVIRADFQEAGEEDVFRKVSGDLAGRADETTVRGKMRSFMAEAKGQILGETS